MTNLGDATEAVATARMKDGLVCAAEVIWQAADKHFRERTTMD